jgi:hypothetical protein
MSKGDVNYVCCLLNDAISDSDYIASDEGAING